jgi:hypothetical protein
LFHLATHADQLVGKKHCNAFCSCPNAHQLADAHVRGAMETKMAAGWEYDELASQIQFAYNFNRPFYI